MYQQYIIKNHFIGISFSNNSGLGPSETHERSSKIAFLIASSRSSAMFTSLIDGRKEQGEKEKDEI